MTRSFLSLVLAGAAVLGMSSLVRAQDGDVLRLATSFPITSLDPISEGYWMQEFGVGELLMQFREDGEFHPWLLSDLEVIDDTRWRLTVREGVTFQNGRALDAEAVHAAITHQLENSSAAAASFETGSFAVTGDHEITFTSAAPFPALPGLLSDESIFLIYDVEALETAGGDDAAIAASGMYTGPYALDSLGSEELVATRNDAYWQGTPAMDAVSVRFIPDVNARLLAVQNGEVDIALFMPIAVQPVVAAMPGLHFNYDTPSVNTYSGFVNTARPPLDDARVRVALIKAIDYESIANDAFFGIFQPTTSFYSPLFDFAIDTIETDRDAAARLLDDAGWALGNDGLRYKDGQPLELTVLYNPGVSDLVALSGALQAQLREVGFLVTPQGVPDTYAAYGQVEWAMGLHNQANSGNGVPEQFLLRWLATDAPRNYGGYSNAEIDRLAEELAVTVDPERRHELLARVQEIMVDEDPGFLVFTQSRLAVVTNDAYAHYQPGFYFYNLDWQTQPNR